MWHIFYRHFSMSTNWYYREDYEDVLVAMKRRDWLKENKYEVVMG